MHAIKAGEGDVFISAGVETVSRYLKGSSDAIPDTQNPIFAGATTRVAAAAANGATSWTDPRGQRGAARRVHRHGTNRGEPRAINNSTCTVELSPSVTPSA